MVAPLARLAVPTPSHGSRLVRHHVLCDVLLQTLVPCAMRNALNSRNMAPRGPRTLLPETDRRKHVLQNINICLRMSGCVKMMGWLNEFMDWHVAHCRQLHSHVVLRHPTHSCVKRNNFNSSCAWSRIGKIARHSTPQRRGAGRSSGSSWCGRGGKSCQRTGW